MKISVVIPMYNSGCTIERALSSLCCQTYSEFEVIIVDDGSTDDSFELTQKFIDDHDFQSIWKVVRQENGGPSKARNKGMDLAVGEYIAFLDSDDEWLPDKLAVQLEFIESDPDISMIGAPADVIGENRLIKFSSLLFKNYYQTSSVLMRNNKSFRFAENQKYSEDYRLWLEIASTHKCGLNKGKVIIYDGGVSQCNRIGLSTHKLNMVRGELSNYKYLLTKNNISMFTYGVCCCFSLVKFVRRIILNH